MHGKILLALTLVGLVCLATPALSEELRLELDPERTEITFELDATLHSVHGTARLTEGVVEFDPDTGSAAGRIAASTGSADTDNEGRDKDMHGKVLESVDHPEIVFTPASLRGELSLEGESRVELDGTFAIHGEAHALTVEALVRVSGDELEATVEFEVPYVAWGMKNPSKLFLRVAKEVQVRIHGFGTLVLPEAD